MVAIGDAIGYAKLLAFELIYHFYVWLCIIHASQRSLQLPTQSSFYDVVCCKI